LTESKTGRQESLPEQRLDNPRLARECARLDPVEEQALADEGIAGEAALSPEY